MKYTDKARNISDFTLDWRTGRITDPFELSPDFDPDFDRPWLKKPVRFNLTYSPKPWYRAFGDVFTNVAEGYVKMFESARLDTIKQEIRSWCIKNQRCAELWTKTGDKEYLLDKFDYNATKKDPEPKKNAYGPFSRIAWEHRYYLDHTESIRTYNLAADAKAYIILNGRVWPITIQGEIKGDGKQFQCQANHHSNRFTFDSTLQRALMFYNAALQIVSPKGYATVENVLTTSFDSKILKTDFNKIEISLNLVFPSTSINITSF